MGQPAHLRFIRYRKPSASAMMSTRAGRWPSPYPVPSPRDRQSCGTAVGRTRAGILAAR